MHWVVQIQALSVDDSDQWEDKVDTGLRAMLLDVEWIGFMKSSTHSSTWRHRPCEVSSIAHLLPFLLPVLQTLRDLTTCAGLPSRRRLLRLWSLATSITPLYYSSAPGVELVYQGWKLVGPNGQPGKARGFEPVGRDILPCSQDTRSSTRDLIDRPI